jgi:hypothetical protein
MTDLNEEIRTGEDEREDRHLVHVHLFNTTTAVADGHQHAVQGTTGPARLAGASHIHRIKVRTSFHADDATGHWHWLDIMTGPAIYTMDGSHVHTYQGTTSFDDGHSHDVENSTAQAPDIPEAAPLPAKTTKVKTVKR